jgi:hypothetical protein
MSRDESVTMEDQYVPCFEAERKSSIEAWQDGYKVSLCSGCEVEDKLQGPQHCCEQHYRLYALNDCHGWTNKQIEMRQQCQKNSGMTATYVRIIGLASGGREDYL